MSIIDRARELRAVIEKNAETMDDTAAMDAAELFPNWDSNAITYSVGQRVRYNGVLYKVIQDHIPQAGWTPEAAPSLFAKVLIPDESVIPEWEQPDSTNPYKAGDKVIYNGQTWVSTIDGNVWAPGVYGWTLVN